VLLCSGGLGQQRCDDETSGLGTLRSVPVQRSSPASTHDMLDTPDRCIATGRGLVSSAPLHPRESCIWSRPLLTHARGDNGTLVWA
jgi:hypothetical protein